MIKLLMFSTDRAIFDTDSAVCLRLQEQALLVSELHVVVLTPKGEKFKEFQAGEKLRIYPTLSSGKWGYLPDAYRVAQSIIKKHDDAAKWLITTQDPFELGVLGYLLGMRFRVPIHLQIHTDPWSEEWKRERKGNRLRFALMLFLLSRASGVRVVSKRVYERVLRSGIPNERVTQVPIYTDVAKWKKAKPTFDLHRSYKLLDKIVFANGRLQPEKNFHGLIRAFARVVKVVPNTMLLIVGSGPERERLSLLASSLGISDSVIMLPWARDVASYYKTCDLYVQPSLYEGWGLSVVEAMSSGAPVLMTDVGVAGELVRNGETGVVVPVGDEQVLAEAMIDTLNDKTLCETYRAAAFREVKKLPSQTKSLEEYKKSWVDAYQHGHKKTRKKSK